MSIAPHNPMTAAIEYGDVETVARLCREHPRLVHTFDVKHHDWGDEQWLPLHRAALADLPAAIDLLLEYGANPDALTRFATPDHARATALHWAAWMGHADAAALLLDRGAAIDLRDVAGSTPLHYACLNGQLSTAGLLVHRGADHEAVDEHGRTPLLASIAAEHHANAIAIALLLIDHGLNVNATNPLAPRRYTALHTCIDAGPHRLPVAQRLVAAGADVTIKDPESLLTPLETARMFVRMGHEAYQTYVDLLT